MLRQCRHRKSELGFSSQMKDSQIDSASGAPDRKCTSMDRPRLSVVIITRNEIANMARCLHSVAFADEVVVLDQASTDGTGEFAREKGARVTVHADWPGFGIQKQRAVALATGDWILSLDADEVVTEALRHDILLAMAAPDKRAWMMPRRTLFCGSWIRHCGWTPDHVLRLFPSGQAQFTDDLVHERLETKLPIAHMKGPLLHYSYPSPEQYWRKLSTYSQMWAAQRFERGQRSGPVRALLSGLFAFIKSYVLRAGFLDGWAGFHVCLMQAQSAHGKHFTLYWMWVNRDKGQGD